jgi:hypothetical protein
MGCARVIESPEAMCKCDREFGADVQESESERLGCGCASSIRKAW